MKKPVTLRLDPHLLAAAKRAAGAENRTLTNFIETLVKERVGAVQPHHMEADPPASQNESINDR